MKVQVMSDLHLASHIGLPEDLVAGLQAPADVLVLAGDVCEWDGLRYYIEEIMNIVPESKQVLFQSGNHEYYGEDIGVLKAHWYHSPIHKSTNFHMLDLNPFIMGKTIFIGAVGWADNTLKPTEPLYRHISDFTRNKSFSNPMSIHTHSLYDQILLRSHLVRNSYLKTVCITHTPPSHKSLAKEYIGDKLNWFFVNDWEDIIEEQKPNLWIHGHVHQPHDYMIGDTRIVCNPYGYQGEGVDFNPLKIVEI